MKRAFPLLWILLSFCFTVRSQTGEWTTLVTPAYTIHFQETDQAGIFRYMEIISGGCADVQAFFGESIPQKFEVYVYPGRHALDSAWSKAWGMPDFRSECWMVAGGTAKQLDLLSPAKWKTEACEHVYDDSLATRQLITHELVHVFHGQKNASPDFSDITGLDWFVEGLATYASGQCDEARIKRVKKLLDSKTVPSTLDTFWTGNEKYGLSGTMVMYLDKRYGRKTLIGLLPFNRKEELLKHLGVDEPTLLDEWRQFMTNTY